MYVYKSTYIVISDNINLTFFKNRFRDCTSLEQLLKYC